MAEVAKASVYLDDNQAAEKLKELSIQADKFAKKMNEARKANDKAGFDKAKKEYTAAKKEMNSYKSSVVDVTKVMNNLSGTSMNNLIKTQRTLERQIKGMNKNTKEEIALYKAKVAQLKKVKAKTSEVRKEMSGFSTATGKVRGGLMKLKNLLPVLGIGALILGFKRLTKIIADFGKKASGLSAITGLVGKDLEWIKEKSREINADLKRTGILIQQTGTDILDAYKIVGSAKPELLKHKEALAEVTKQTIILSEASGMTLVDAVKSLTGDLNQFNTSADQSSRFINVMAAGAQAGAGDIQYISDAIEKSGTTMNLMHISYEKGVALVEAVAPRFAKAAMAGNSLDKVLLKMKEKGIGYTNGVFDINAALLELKTRFNQGETSAELFGVEHSKMAEILVQSIDEINRYTEVITGTNTAVEMAITNTDNLRGELDNTGISWTNLLISLNEGNGIISSSFRTVVGWVNKFIRGLEILNKYGSKKNFYKIMNADLEKQSKIIDEVNRQMNIEIEVRKKTGETTKQYYENRLSQMKRQSKEYQAKYEIEIIALEHILSLIKEQEEAEKRRNELLEIARKKEEDAAKKTAEEAAKKAAEEAAKKSFDPTKIDDEEIRHIIEMGKQKQAAYEKIRQENIISLKAAFDKETTLRQTKHNEELLSLGNNEEGKKQLKEKFRKEELQRQIDFLNTVIAECKNIINAGGIEGLSIEEAMLSDEEKDALLTKIDELKLKLSELQLAMPGAEGEEEGKGAGIFGLFGMSDEDYEKLEQDFQYAINIASQIGEMWSAINQRMTNEENERLRQYENNADKKRRALEKQLNSGLISQEQYFNSITKLDADLDKERKKVEIAQAKRARKQAVFQILLNTGIAIMNALATAPSIIVGFVMAALAAVLGAVQLAAIPPVPSYGSGNYLDVIGADDDKKYHAKVTDSKHPSGLYNEPTYVPGFGLFGETKKPELVFNPEDTEMLLNTPGIINAINATLNRSPQHQEGNTREIITNTETFTDPALLAIMERIEEKLSEPAKAYLVTDEDYIDTHKEVIEKHDELLRQVNG